MTKLQSLPLKWKPVVGFAGYEVSDHGDVRSYLMSRPARDGRLRRREPRILKPDVDDRQRRRFTLRRDGRSVKKFAGVLVLEAFVGPCPPDLECCHNDGQCDNDAVTNLRWDTHSANLLDRRRHGTANCGEKCWKSKLTKKQVLAIRRIGYPLKQHAEKYEVSETLISLILRRRIWQHV